MVDARYDYGVVDREILAAVGRGIWDFAAIQRAVDDALRAANEPWPFPVSGPFRVIDRRLHALCMEGKIEPREVEVHLMGGGTTFSRVGAWELC